MSITSPLYARRLTSATPVAFPWHWLMLIYVHTSRPCADPRISDVDWVRTNDMVSIIRRGYKYHVIYVACISQGRPWSEIIIRSSHTRNVTCLEQRHFSSPFSYHREPLLHGIRRSSARHWVKRNFIRVRRKCGLLFRFFSTRYVHGKKLCV